MSEQVENIEVQNIVHFKQQYKLIVQQVVQVRKQAGLTQDFIAEWLNFDRRKIIAFEGLKKVDLQLLLLYADKFSIDIKLNFTSY